MKPGILLVKYFVPKPKDTTFDCLTLMNDSVNKLSLYHNTHLAFEMFVNFIHMSLILFFSDAVKLLC